MPGATLENISSVLCEVHGDKFTITIAKDHLIAKPAQIPPRGAGGAD